MPTNVSFVVFSFCIPSLKSQDPSKRCLPIVLIKECCVALRLCARQIIGEYSPLSRAPMFSSSIARLTRAFRSATLILGLISYSSYLYLYRRPYLIDQKPSLVFQNGPNFCTCRSSIISAYTTTEGPLLERLLKQHSQRGAPWQASSSRSPFLKGRRKILECHAKAW